MKFTIKRVDPDKYELAIRRLQKQCLPADEPLDCSTGYWWLAWGEDGRLAGFCSLHASQQWGLTGYLSRAGVVLHYQGYGLQKRLIRARERLAKRLGWIWLITDTTHNPASANNLISCGFKMYSPTRPYMTEGAVYWRKRVK
jgi:GNAT superfamily N-acetyltransferase